MAQFNRSEMFKMAHKAAKEYKASHANCQYSYGYLFSHALKNAYKMFVSQFQKELANEKAAPEVAKLNALIGDATNSKRANIIKKYVASRITEAGLSNYVSKYQTVSLANSCEHSKELRIYSTWNRDYTKNDAELKSIAKDLETTLNHFNYTVYVC